MPDLLFGANIALYGAGVGILLVWSGRWLCGKPILEVRPPRAEGFGVELVLIAMGGYLLVATAAIMVATQFRPGVALIAASSSVPASDRRATGEGPHVPDEAAGGAEPAAGPLTTAEDAGDPRTPAEQPAEDPIAAPAPTTTDFVAALAAGNVAQLVGFVICVVLAWHAVRGDLGVFLCGPAGRRVAAIMLGGAVAVVALPLCDGLAWAAENLLARFGMDELSREHTVIRVMRAADCPWWGVAVLWIGAAVIAPAAEEAFFRGILQNWLRGAIGRAGALAGSSLAFGLAHAGGQTQAVPALVALGLLLGWSYQRSGSLAVPVLAHALFNLKTLLWVTLTPA